MDTVEVHATDGREAPAARPGSETLRQLGLDPTAVTVYLGMLRDRTGGIGHLADRVGLDPATVRAALERLAEIELCALDGDVVQVAPPHRAIDGLITRRERELRAAVTLLEEARSTVGDLLEGYLAGHRQEVAEGVDRLVGLEPVLALLRGLAEQARVEVLTVLPSVPDAATLGSSEDADLLALRSGVAMRTILPASAAGRPELWQALARRVDAGLQVRLHPAPPMQCIAVDGSCAVIPLDPSAVRDGAWVVRNRGLLQPVLLLVRSLWSQAVAVDPLIDPSTDEARVREVFRLLAQGHKDEAIARRLGASVRTVRRLVAAGMQMLGTDSRFEAGVMAERRGWLNET